MRPSAPPRQHVGGSLSGLERPFTPAPSLQIRSLSTPPNITDKPLPLPPPSSPSAMSRWSSSTHSTLDCDAIDSYNDQDGSVEIPTRKSRLLPSRVFATVPAMQSSQSLGTPVTIPVAGIYASPTQQTASDTMLAVRDVDHGRPKAIGLGTLCFERSGSSPAINSENCAPKHLDRAAILYPFPGAASADSLPILKPPPSQSENSGCCEGDSRRSGKRHGILAPKLLSNSSLLFVDDSKQDSLGGSVQIQAPVGKSQQPILTEPHTHQEAFLLPKGEYPTLSASHSSFRASFLDRKRRKASLRQSFQLIKGGETSPSAAEKADPASEFSETSPDTPTISTAFSSLRKMAKRSIRRHKGSGEIYQAEKEQGRVMNLTLENRSCIGPEKSVLSSPRASGSQSQRVGVQERFDDMYEVVKSISPARILHSFTQHTAFSPRSATRPKQTAQFRAAPVALFQESPLPDSPTIPLTQQARFPLKPEKCISDRQFQLGDPRSPYQETASQVSSLERKDEKENPKGTTLLPQHLSSPPTPKHSLAVWLALRTPDKRTASPLSKSSFTRDHLSSPQMLKRRESLTALQIQDADTASIAGNPSRKAARRAKKEEERGEKWREEMKSKIVVVNRSKIGGAVSGNSLGTGSWSGVDDGANWL